MAQLHVAYRLTVWLRFGGVGWWDWVLWKFAAAELWERVDDTAMWSYHKPEPLHRIRMHEQVVLGGG